MASPRTDPEPRGRSLVVRVAAAAAIAAAVGGALGATGAAMTAGGLDEVAEDQALLAATAALAREVSDELGDDGDGDDDHDEDEEGEDDPDELRGELAEELEDLGLPGARSAVVRDGRRLAGDLTGHLPAPGECRTTGSGSDAIRTCTVAADPLVVSVASSAARAVERRSSFAVAALLGALLGAVAGLIASWWIARWAMRPVAGLQAAVARVSPAAPSSSVLGSPGGYAEVDALQATLGDVLDRLGASLSHAQRFAGHAAHELRTPLTALIGELDLLSELSIPPDATASAARARRTATELRLLVDRLLLLASPSDLPRFRPEAVDLADVAAEAIATLDPVTRARVTTQAAEDVLVQGDPSLLRALIQNGLDNALKYSDDGVTLRARLEGTTAILEIADRGPGVPVEERERVFAAFQRATGRPGGHGLGLALIAHVATRHGGAAEILEDDALHGALLRVRLPAWRPQDEPARDA
jgi:signal transduction histidine kinase